jgi:hypothetical protein
MRRKPSPPEIVLKAPLPARDRQKTAADLVEALSREGIPAELVQIGAIEGFVRRQAEQLLLAAQRCAFPDVRAEMEETARAVLAELDRGEPPTCERCGEAMDLAQTVPAVAGHPEIRSYRCSDCGHVMTTV